MKIYIVSLGTNVLAGVNIGLLSVRSPALER